MGHSQIAKPTEPPKERIAIINPDVIAMSSRGVDNCAAVKSVQRHVPRPIPKKTGYPHTLLPLAGPDVAIRMKKTIMLTNATMEGIWTLLVIEQNAPARTAKTA